MRPRLLTPLAALPLLLVAPRAVAQDSVRPTPPRPSLDAAADTNSPRAYMDLARGQLKDHPDRAAEAFHWAALLDPESAEPLYAERVAALLSDRERLVRYFEGDRKVLESPEVQAIDSLYLRALWLNPFLVSDLDHHLLTAYVTEVVMRNARMDYGADVGAVASELRYEIDKYLRTDASVRTRARMAAAERRFKQALSLYAEAVKRATGVQDRAALRTERGRVFFVTAQFDSASAEIGAALAGLRERDSTELLAVYQSKAMLQHRLGVIRESQGDRAGAREAYQAAASEDLGFHPAHVRLATLAMEDGDTAQALVELDLAVQALPDHPLLRVSYGYALASVGRLQEALEHLRKATEQSPWYALPHSYVAQILDALGRTDEAVRHYQAFLSRASRTDPLRAETEQRLTALGVAPDS